MYTTTYYIVYILVYFWVCTYRSKTYITYTYIGIHIHIQDDQYSSHHELNEILFSFRRAKGEIEKQREMK